MQNPTAYSRAQHRLFKLLIFLAIFLCYHPSAHAYIGPGAGFAFLGSGFIFILTILMAVATFALWPFRIALRAIQGKGVGRSARAKRVVIVGLDGLEPKLVDQYMAEGSLPNLKALSEEGSYQRLGTTLPALSPVAWSTFQTGVNPGAHNIFDFLTRDKRNCLPLLSSTDTETTDGFKLFGIPLGSKKTRAVIARKSQPFWKILGKKGINSNIIRVPISYPPEKFDGNILSAMCTPDLKGTQGSFTFYTTRTESVDNSTGGEKRLVKREGNIIRTSIEGPPAADGIGFLKCDFELFLNPAAKTAEIRVGDYKEELRVDSFSKWVELEFKSGRTIISGICRFCLREFGDEISLYASPVNVNPEKPALAIAHPLLFSSWLAKRQGPFGTLGLLEDTWSRNEQALDDAGFLEQAYLTHDEREVMFFDVLERTREGACVCVFDASDRIQHMFWRYLDKDHPSPCEDRAKFGNVIPDMYKRMDTLVGKVRSKLNKDDVLIVLSDHGFSSFRRCVNVNTWLMQNGLLALKDGKTVGADYFQDIDWSRTKAFAVGLSGLYLNIEGRERFGIVKESEIAGLKAQISKGLEALCDPQNQAAAVRKVYDTSREYRGLYTDEAPDLIVGYAPGYRVSWDSVTGSVEAQVFSDNTKAWSGDHHIDPKIIPGILFCNRKLREENANIVDIAPTVLDLFAVKIPSYMEGKVLA